MSDTSQIVSERFWKHVKKTPSGCWLFNGQKKLGRFNINGRSWVASRAAWLFSKGRIPKGKCVCHRCDVPGCCRPKHLFLGTHLENMQDRDAKGRGTKPPIHFGETHHKAKLTEAKVRRIRLLRKKGWTLQRIGDLFGVSKQQVRHVLMGMHWKHVA